MRDWFTRSIPGDWQSVCLDFRKHGLQAALKRHITSIEERLELGSCLPSWRSTRFLASIWPGLFLFQLPLLLLGREFWISHARPCAGCSRRLAQPGTLCSAPVDAAWAILCASIVIGVCGCFHVLTVPTHPILANYTNLVVRKRPGTATVWHISAMEFVTMALGWVLHGVEWGVVGFQCCDPPMGQGACGVLVPLSSGIRRIAHHYGFVSFVVDCAFDSLRVYLVYFCSGKSIGRLIKAYTVGLHTSLPTAVLTTGLKWFFRPGWKMRVGTLVASRLYVAWVIVSMVPTAERCGLASAVAHTHPTFQVDPEVVDPRPFCRVSVMSTTFS